MSKVKVTGSLSAFSYVQSITQKTNDPKVLKLGIGKWNDLRISCKHHLQDILQVVCFFGLKGQRHSYS